MLFCEVKNKMAVFRKYIGWCQSKINAKNRSRLTNQQPTLVCSNCTGGFLYHWLGLQFRSPFINLWMKPGEFISALENFDKFLDTPFHEVYEKGIEYPIAEGYNGLRVYFTHYRSFDEALHKWNERLERMDRNHIGIMLTNWNGDYEQLKKFNTLPFKNKIVFTDKKFPEFKSAVWLKGLKIGGARHQNVYFTKNPFTGKRYIDQFDYVDFLNSLVKGNI